MPGFLRRVARFDEKMSQGREIDFISEFYRLYFFGHPDEIRATKISSRLNRLRISLDRLGRPRLNPLRSFLRKFNGVNRPTQTDTDGGKAGYKAREDGRDQRSEVGGRR